MYIAKNIRYLRKTKNFTQSHLSDQLGIVANQISKYESGLSDPPIEKIILMAQLFEVDLNDFVLADLSKGERYRGQELPKGSKTEKLYEQLIAHLKGELNRYKRAIREEAPDLAKQLRIDKE
jgi:transcriptional regulator with XRE-family HTH domain